VFGWEFETFDAEFHEPERALEGFRIFADESPGLAAEFVEFLPGNEIKGVAAFELSERWFEGNREAALTWLSGLASAEREESRPFQSFAAEAMAEMWALEAPNSALEWALGREDQEKWFDFISVAASVYGETDPSGASNWFFTLQPESLRQELVPVMAGAVAQKDFDSAVLLINSATDGKAREEAIMAAAMASVDEAPLRTIQWLLSLEESPETLDTIYHTGAAWADHSPVDVAEWLATAPDNMKGVDQVIAGMISSHAQHEPESCFRWALQIQNEVSREQALEELFYDWEIKRGVANMKSDLNRLQVSINGANVELVNEVLERRSMERN
jgi:hypothetical protein